MVNLTVLDLSFNLLPTLSQEMMDILSLCGQGLSVNLEGNPLECSSHTLNFIKWLQNGIVRFPKRPEYICRYKGKFRSLADDDLGQIVREMGTECMQLAIILGMTIPVVMVTVIVAPPSAVTTKSGKFASGSCKM